MYFIRNSPQAGVLWGTAGGRVMGSLTRKKLNQRELQQSYRKTQRKRDIEKMADKRKREHKENGCCGGNDGDGVCFDK